ncbi:MAG: hypothetical protein D6724_08520 [Armatimonadetes bacterium]|nr:MAG: hypothetical protein D6724_08520 [Armatimonadota bacterium]
MIGALCLAAVVWAAQDAVTLKRVFVAGEERTLYANLSVESSFGEILVQLDLREKTLEADGDKATVELALSNLRVKMGDQEMPSNPPQPLRLRMNSQGFVLNGLPVAVGNNLAFLRYLFVLPGSPLSVGKAVPFAFESSDPSGTKLTGEAALLRVSDGNAVVTVRSKLLGPGFSKEMSLAYTAKFDLKTGKLVEADGTVTNVPALQGMEVTAIQFTIDTKKRDQMKRIYDGSSSSR